MHWFMFYERVMIKVSCDGSLLSSLVSCPFFHVWCYAAGFCTISDGSPIHAIRGIEQG